MQGTPFERDCSRDQEQLCPDDDGPGGSPDAFTGLKVEPDLSVPQLMSRMDDSPQGTRYLAGDSFSNADCAAGRRLDTGSLRGQPAYQLIEAEPAAWRIYKVSARAG